MKQILIASIFILFISCCNTKPEQKFTINRGLNASHWLSQTEKRGSERKAYMTEKDFKNIAEMGFDHIRLPIDEEQMWNDQGEKNQEAFDLLHFAINECKKNNLRVIVDLHILRSHHFNEKEKIKLWQDSLAQQTFISCWKQLSAELINYPLDLVAYEPLNEAVADESEDWNKLINWVVAELRKLEPQRTIIMGSNRWQSPDTFKDLRIPEGDTNLILSFHFYSPLAFTHYKTWWSEFKDLGLNTEYPGWSIDTVNNNLTDEKKRATIKNWTSYCTKDSLEKELLQAITIADKHHLQLFCGEFGCFPSSAREDRLRWYNDIIDIYKKHNIAWSHWNYKNDFPIVDEKTLQQDKEIVSILMK